MAPVRGNHALLRKYADLSRNLVIRDEHIFCKLYSVRLSHAKKSDITQHLATTKHKSNENLYDRKYQSSLNLETDNRAQKWASALSEAGIPFSCLNNEKYRSFPEK